MAQRAEVLARHLSLSPRTHMLDDQKLCSDLHTHTVELVCLHPKGNKQINNQTNRQISKFNMKLKAQPAADICDVSVET